jgi:hypothetical protein
MVGRKKGPRALGLIDHAHTVGCPVVAIPDGFNGCHATLRQELLDQLSAFGLRHSSTLLVTSQDRPPEARRGKSGSRVTRFGANHDRRSGVPAIHRRHCL